LAVFFRASKKESITIKDNGLNVDLNLYCKSCGEEISSDWDICPNCLEPIIQISKCRQCGKEIKGTWQICPSCKTPTGNTVTNGRTPHGSRTPHQTNHSSSLSDIKEKTAPIKNVELQINELIAERYLVKSKIGQGGFGSVYEVFDKITERTMALKTLPYITKDSINNILLEFESRDRLDNVEHVIKAYQPQIALSKEQTIVIYPMELADMSLRNWLVETSGHIEDRLEEGLEIFKQACLGVEAIHQAGLIHLDLKPENILLIKNKNFKDLSQKWKVKISDFGLARGIGMENLEILHDGVGTPAYMAPEQIMAARWKDVGKEADIYSLGMILYEMIDGDLPYSGSAKLIKEKKLNPLIEISPLKSKHDVAPIAMKCLTRDKKNRIGTISDLIYLIDEKRRKEVELNIRKKQASVYYEEIKKLVEERKFDEALVLCRKSALWDKKENPVYQWNNIIENINKLKLIQEEKLKKGEMVLVDGGSFEMGSLDFADEKPVRKVEVKSFLIDKFPVTVKQFREFCNSKGRRMPPVPEWGWIDDHPVVNISWQDAYDYAEWAGKRLPTEAEWEFASRGGTKSKKYKFAGSNNLNDVAWYSANSDLRTNPIGTKSPNELGIYDMCGNVLEWCSDWYSPYDSSDINNPSGGKKGNFKVLRGGSWNVNELGCRITLRNHYDPDTYDNYFGFRCVKDLSNK